MTRPKGKPTYEHTPESREALARVIPLCTSCWPCNKQSCARCRQRVQDALEQADMENRLVSE